MKQLIVVFILSLNLSVYSQTLKNIQLNLNVGARVYDVEYIPGMDAYIIVGDFTHVNNVPKSRVALIDAQTFALKNNAPFNSFNLSENYEVVRSVEYTKVNNVNYLVLGGNFESLSNGTRIGLVLYTFTGNLNPSSVFVENNWNYWVMGYGSSEAGVADLLFSNDTLMISGEFDGLDLVDGSSNSGPGTTAGGYSFVALKINPSHASKFSLINSSISNGIVRQNGRSIYSMAKRGSDLFIAGGSTGSTSAFNLLFQRRNSTNFAVQSGFATDGNTTHLYSRVEFLNDSIIMANRNTGGHGYDALSFYKKNGLVQNGFSDYRQSFNSPLSVRAYGAIPYNSDIIVYNRVQPGVSIPDYYAIRRFQFDGVDESNEIQFSLIGNENSISFSNPMTTNTVNDNLFAKNGKLFFSINSMSQVNGQTRVGLAVFCLEPTDPKPFINPQLEICAGNERVYTIPASLHATGYEWSYSGQGAKYLNTSNNQYYDLNTVIFNSATANTLTIRFQPGVTPGVLSVRPFSVCNTTTDYQYAKPMSINLSVAPPPPMSMPDSLFFSCYSDSLAITMNTPIIGGSYAWSFQSPLATVIGNVSTLNLTKAANPISGYYYGLFTEPALQCQNLDSVFVYFDTLAALIPTSSFLQTPSPFNCLSDSVVIDLDIPDALIRWKTNPDSNFIPSPLVLYSFDTTDVFGYATYLHNGCTSQQPFEVEVVNSQVAGYVNGSNLSALPVPFQVINCTTPTTTLQCNVPLNGSAQWNVGGNLIGNVLNLSIADTTGMHQLFHTKSYTVQLMDSISGCQNYYDVVIKFDLETPFVTQMEDHALNCSQNAVTLTHLLNGSNGLTEGWLDPQNNQTGSNILTANVVGTYYYHVQNTVNGCFNVDTVEVIQSNELLLNLIADTLVCDGQMVALTVSNINNSEPTTYNWSNGLTGATINATGGLTSQLTVIGQNQSGCIGYDTIQIAIPEPVQVEFILTSTCVEAAILISNISGGTGNYQYAIDGGTWQTNTFFGDLSFGSHQIAVLDDLGCIYNFTQVVDGSGESPDINFLVSTYNLEGDTLAIVNISNYTGYDSLVWVLPEYASIHSIDDSMVVVSIEAGGWYDVTLKGYIDTCSYRFTKSVFFGTEKPLFDVDYAERGIKNLTIYPNPTTGQFVLSFELGIQQNYSVAVTNLQGQPVSSMQHSGSGTEIMHEMMFPAGIPTGNYRIHIVADYDAKQASILLID